MSELFKKFKNKESGILLYSITPPGKQNTHERNLEITRKRIERLQNINIDGLAIYDLQNEESRTGHQKSFSVSSNLEPVEYYLHYVRSFKYTTPPIIYQAAGNYSVNEMKGRLSLIKEKGIVLVGPPSKKESAKTDLLEAYTQLSDMEAPLGGVAIPERHTAKGDEPKRMVNKQRHGCDFFITQVVYDVERCKTMLSEDYNYCIYNNIALVPIILTVSPCGYQKTLEIFKWLGISVPKWIEHDLLHSANPLANSTDVLKDIIRDIVSFCLKKNIPVGCNIESISKRKDEVLASFELVSEIEQIFTDANI